jgi:arylsulfatase A-like enzyme
MLTRTALAASLAGFAVGLLDAFAAWGRMAQFEPGAGGRLVAALLAAMLYAFAAGVVGPLVALVVAGLARFTALGPLWRHAVAQHDAVRARDPRDALVGLSIAIAGVPLLGAALALAYRVGFVAISTRKHKGLVVAVAMIATIVALGVAVVAAFALGRVVELGLRRALRGRVLTLASHHLAPAVAGAALVGVGGAVGYALFKKPLSLDQLQLRPIVVALLLPVAFAALWRFVTPRRRAFAAAPAVALIGALLLGAGDGPRKAAAAYTGLSAPIVNALRRVFDLDRDRYAAVFGGGDCDDLDRGIHPGAYDVPDDGVDQNCMGGDPKLARSPGDARFAPLPPGLPPDTNVVLITVDALRADHLGAYGYGRPTSPALDAIAAEGVVFENAWAHAPSTRYSIPAILTGRYPSQVLWDPAARTPESWWPGLKLENRTIAEIMHDAGLATGAVLNYHYFAPARRMNQGFDYYDNENARLHMGSDPASTSGSSAREQTDKAIAWIDQVQGRRFFLWVHYYDTHYRWEKHAGTMEFGGAPVDLYDHEIRYTDEQIARLVAHLQARGAWGKTIVVVTGDHGEGFGEHGIEFHGYHLYAAQTRVPLIVRVPGVAPRRVQLPVAHVDLLPTLANLVGAPAAADMLGRSVLGELSGAAGFDPDADRTVFQEVSFEGPTERRAAATKKWHLLYNMVPDNTWELYDLEKDPGETRDVYGSGAEDVKVALLTWIDTLQFPPGAGEKLGAALLKERPAPRIEARADFGGKVRLLGVDLAPEAVARGGTFQITYYFEALGTLKGDWRVFVHIEGPGGRFQDDHVPVDGVYTFARWKKGQYVADARTVTVPPNMAPGDYTIWMGLWQPKKGNLPAEAGDRNDGKNRVRVGTVRVER